MNLLQASLLLTSNFSNDPLFVHSFQGTTAQRHRGMEAYFSAALDFCLAEGEIILAPSNAGLLAWIPGTVFPPPIDPFKMAGQPAYVLEGWARLNQHEETPESIIHAEGRNYAYIWLLAVDFSVRGKGFGRWLVEACIDQAREAGMEEVWLSTENESSIPFYTSLGFMVIRSTPSAAGLFTYVFKKALA